MSAAAWSGGADAAALALAVFAEPTRFGELVRGGGALPTDTIGVMRTAAEAIRLGRPDALNEAQRAALFFVEHVLLAHGADHYRALGLNRDATGEQIRDHYRIMMGIFHPDRQGWADTDREKLSARINLAHQVLRDDYRRAAYDLERIQDRSRATAPNPVPRRVRVHREVAPATFGDRLPLTMRRHFPQYVLGSVALAGLVAVLTVYANRPPAGAIGASRAPAKPPAAAATAERSELLATTQLAEADLRKASAAHANAAVATPSGVPSAHENAAPVGAVAKLPPAASAALAAPMPPRLLAPETTTVRAAPPPAATSDAPSSELPAARPTVIPVGSAPAAERPPAPVPTSQPAEVAAGSDPRAAGPRTAAQADASAKAEAIPSAARDPEIAAAPAVTAQDVTRLMSKFSSSYQLGDIDRFMVLFADDARSETGRKSQIRKDYEQLFGTTQSRHIELVDMRWSQANTSARGEGGYLVRVTPKGESAEQVYSGSIRVELTKRGAEVLISGLFHKPSN